MVLSPPTQRRLHRRQYRSLRQSQAIRGRGVTLQVADRDLSSVAAGVSQAVKRCEAVDLSLARVATWV